MRITVVSTSRADWNSTGMVVKALRAANGWDVSLLLMAANGAALDALMSAVRADGMDDSSDRIVHNLGLVRDDALNLSSAAGHAMRTAAEAFCALSPDLLVLPGDRWEIAPVAFSAALAGIPIAHLGGGDRTAGSLDDKWRNAITQLASVHLCTNDDALDRLLNNRIGEEAARWAANVGSPALDRIAQIEFPTAGQLVSAFGAVCDGPFVVVNWQPETGSTSPNKGLHEIFHAMAQCGVPRAVFVGQNPDLATEEARHEIEIECSASGRDWIYRESFAPKVYLSLLRHCSCLVGNSSSGIYEAPYIGTPVINVGDRQLGRAFDQLVMWALPHHTAIAALLRRVLEQGRPAMPSEPGLYGHGNSCAFIVNVLREYANANGLMAKKKKQLAGVR